MASKKATESKKDKTIHKTAKSKSNGKSKLDKDAKSTERGTSSSDVRKTSKNRSLDEKQTDTKEKLTSELSKKTEEKSLILDDDVEGMSVPPSDDQQSPKVQPDPDRKPRVQPRQEPPRKSTNPVKSQNTKKPPEKSTMRLKKKSSDEDEDDEEEDDEATVKQFSLPAFKILSGASVAPVQMYPQKVIINKSDPTRRHWGSALTGLFQNSKLTLKLRMLRLLLIWIFFRVLNKQTAWLSDMLSIGLPDEEPPGPKVKPPPGERFVKVFREGDPNPYHVRVKRPL